MEATYEAQEAALRLADELAGHMSDLPLTPGGKAPSVPVVRIPRWLVRFVAFISRGERSKLARDNGGVAIMAIVIEPPDA